MQIIEWASMKRKPLVAAVAITAIAALTSVIYAYPPPPPGGEVYVTYYTDATHTEVVGVRAIGRDSRCAPYHISWGSTSSYGVTTIAPCENGGGGPVID